MKPVMIKGLVVSACLATASFIGTSAFAQTLFIDDFSCEMGPAGFCEADFPSDGFKTHSLMTPSGNIVLTCNCFPTNGKPPNGTVIIEDKDCGTKFGSTTDMHFVWTKGGRASLTCTIVGNN